MGHTRPPVRITGLQPELPDAATERARELAQLARDIAVLPAYPQVVEFLVHARALGLDVGEPDVVDRAIEAGRASYDAQQKSLEAAASYAIFSRVERDHHSPLVYYMRNGDRIKIGTSTFLSQRVNTISPQGVMAVEPGGRRVEKQRHRDFEGVRLRGEWFQLNPQLADHIIALRERFEREVGVPTEAWLAENTAGKRESPRRRTTNVGSFARNRPFSPVALPGNDLPPDAKELLPAARIAEALQISKQRFDHWRKVGKVRPAAVTEDGRRLYRLSEALAVPLRRTA